MTAGVFARHGVWTGTCRSADANNLKGYYENAAIRGVVMKWHRAIVHKGILAQKKPGFRAAIEKAVADDGYDGGPWLWKGSALYWPAFFEFEPRYVVCVRSPQRIFESCRRSGIFGRNLSDAQLRDNILFHQKQLEYLCAAKNAVRVFTGAVANGNYQSLERALEHCNITPDTDVFDDFIDAELWNRA